jgi:WD40 repeat protein
VGTGTATSLSNPSQTSYSQAISAVQFSPFKKGIAAVASDEACVKLWDTARGTTIATFAQHKAAVKGISFSPVNELLLCSAGRDRLLLFYDVQVQRSRRLDLSAM